MQILGFPFFESQAKWISQVLSGRRTLLSRDDMMKSLEEFYHSREIAGIPKHCTHDIADFDVTAIIHYLMLFSKIFSTFLRLRSKAAATM